MDSLHSEQDKEQSVDPALQFQQFFDDKKDDLFNRTVTLGMRHGSISGHLNPKDRVWCHNKRQSRAGKAKIVESQLPRGTTITAHHYCKSL